MEEWKEYKIGDICCSISDTDNGHSSKVVLINTSDVLNGKCLNHTKVPNKNLKGQFKKTFKKGDILYSEIRPINKRFAFIDFDSTNYIASTKLMVIRANDIVSPIYLHYILQSKYMLETLQMLAESRSGTFPQITFTELANQKILLPPRNIQDKIVDILSSIDNKIEVNRKINENLEQQAQALFKSWFVDFEPFQDGEFEESELGMIPKGWKVGNIFDVSNIFDSKRIPLSNMERAKMRGIYPYYGATSVMDYVNDYIFNGTYLLLGEDGSVMTEKGYPFLQYVSGKIWVNNHAHILQGKNEFSTEMLYCLMSKYNIKPLVTGAVQQKLSQTNMKKILLTIAPNNILKKFNNLISPMYSKIRNNTKEIKELSLMRDTLLPKLMSGEIEIKE